jgi:hypothetical protein
VKFEQSLDGKNWDTLDDSFGNEIVITLDAATKIVTLAMVHCKYFRVVGYADGDAGTLTGIQHYFME